MSQRTPQERERQDVLLQRFNNEDWRELWRKTLNYVCSTHGFKAHIRGREKDIVQEAIVRTLDGKRRVHWPFEGEDADLQTIKDVVLYHLFNTADSLVSHAWEKDSHLDFTDSLEGDTTSVTWIGWGASGPSAIETLEQQALVRELEDSLVEETDDEERKNILRLYFENPEMTHKELAGKSSAGIKSVQSTMRWLRRRLAKLFKLK